VHPLAFTRAVPAQGAAAAAFTHEGNFDSATYFVGPDARLYRRGDGAADGPGWRHRRALETARGTFTPPHSGRDVTSAFLHQAVAPPVDPNRPSREELAADKAAVERFAEKYGDDLPLAAANLEHFLGNTGEQRLWSPADLRQREPITDAEERLREYFSDWIEGRLIPQAASEHIVDALAGLGDGMSLSARSRWTAAFNDDWLERVLNLDTYLAIGNSHLAGLGDFTFTRNGNTIEVAGDVGYRLHDPFDFEKDATFVDIPLDGLPDPVAAGSRLQHYAGFKPYDMVSAWRSRVRGRLVPDGRGGWQLENGLLWSDPHPSFERSAK
jgi:hypothetical protein